MTIKDSYMNGDDWGKWSKYVLIELERLNNELKSLHEFAHNLQGKITSNDAIAKIIEQRLLDITKRLDTLSLEFKDTNETMSNLRVTFAEKMTYGGIGGGIMTVIIELLKNLLT